MYVRALIVVLIILNAGVALWWALQPAAAPPAAPSQPAGVARLELLPTPPTAAAPAVATVAPAAAPSPPPAAPAAQPAVAAVEHTPPPTPAATAAVTPAVPAASPPPAVAAPVPERCASLGPYPARAEADAALPALRGQASRTSVREDKDAGVSTFRVMLPNIGDRAAAQALVKRIAAAGIGDYYVIAQGEDNSIALGQYQSRERAERRQASLVSAGFPAQLVPSGTGQSRWWIDVRSSASVSSLQRSAGASRQRSLDCTALR
ncbi:SPOR domain-containing protein [Xanthomonas campestris pv. campestris]|uniref:SPOR domain-containing protein n=1 Tax=Xanthomonas campestris TaxID=339 RepID=UPI002AD2652D|nr:SPOR domain-containing protein [Xanthomonas campestris]MEA0737372.1 SPOR domain-containing protein [Xanthomonas campestris pv. campestris]